MMSYDARLVVVGLAAFAVANLACCALIPWLWRRRTASSLVRAEELRYLRLLPALVSLLVMTLAFLSFAFFEPRGQEPMGRVMEWFALLAALLSVGAVVRLVRVAIASRRAIRQWMRSAQPIVLDGWSRPAFVVDAAFPIVAIVGVWRPRLRS